MKAAVIGTGKTGGTVADLLGEDAVLFNSDNKPTAQKLKDCDLAIVFVSPDGAAEVLNELIEADIPVVWGTTGFEWPENISDRIKQTGSRWVIGSNFSLGMNLMRKALNLFGKGSELLQNPEYHIHEVHHVHKKDAPSGTALSWQEWLGKESSVSSDRQGDIKGIHSLHIKTKNESIFLKHEAHDRAVFAEGAIWTADYILKHPHIEPGLYSFSSLFDRAFKESL